MILCPLLGRRRFSAAVRVARGSMCSPGTDFPGLAGNESTFRARNVTASLDPRFGRTRARGCPVEQRVPPCTAPSSIGRRGATRTDARQHATVPAWRIEMRAAAGQRAARCAGERERVGRLAGACARPTDPPTRRVGAGSPLHRRQAPKPAAPLERTSRVKKSDRRFDTGEAAAYHKARRVVLIQISSPVRSRCASTSVGADRLPFGTVIALVIWIIRCSACKEIRHARHPAQTSMTVTTRSTHRGVHAARR